VNFLTKNFTLFWHQIPEFGLALKTMRATLLTTPGQTIAAWPGIATEGSGKGY
jgi:hypothetical protein